VQSQVRILSYLFALACLFLAAMGFDKCQSPAASAPLGGQMTA
jgi:hypothetical protein